MLTLSREAVGYGEALHLGPLAKRMKTSVADLVPHCKELGCKILKGEPGGGVKVKAEKGAQMGGGMRAQLPLDGTKPLRDFLPEIKQRMQAKGRK